jgi:hypothetical protein
MRVPTGDGQLVAGARPEILADALDVCRRHQLILREVWPARHGNSVFVARVTVAAGCDLALKRTVPGRSRSEVAALSAWRQAGAAVRLHAGLEADVFLLEWLDGPCLAVCSVATIDVPALGRMLRALHAVSPPAELVELRHLFASNTALGEALPEAMRRLFAHLTGDLYGAELESETLLHGDLSPINVILTAAGPKVIDPVGYRGLAAWDVAQLAAAAYGRGLADLLPGLLAGYGSEPPFLSGHHSLDCRSSDLGPTGQAGLCLLLHA